MAKVFQHEAARRDLIEHFVYLAENAGLDTADRFLANADASFRDLAGQPMMGAPLAPRRRVYRARAARRTGLVELVGSG